MLSRCLERVRLIHTQPSTLVRYVAAALVVALCCAIRSQLPLTGLPYLFFIPGLMYVGFCFGVGPAMLGCVLSVLAAHYFFIGPIGFDDGLAAWLNSLGFGLVTFGMATMCALFRQNLSALSEVNTRLEREVEWRTLKRDGIWNVSPDLISVLSERGDVLAVNPAWQAETGQTEQHIKDGAFFDFISASQWSEALRILREAPIAELDTQGTRSNGQPLHLNWRIARHRGHYFAVARDITPYKERQEAFEHMRGQLQQSQKMEALGQLTGGLAHDVNNLLTVINGSLDMLEQRTAQGRYTELERYIAQARNASDRTGFLTHRLLAYARRQILAGAAVDPTSLVQDMRDLLSRTLTPRITLEVVGPSRPVLCFCDAHQLENSLLNLCINARDAMPQGGRLRVEINQVRVEPEQACATLQVGDYACVRVSDTGTGMPQSILERAFDPFFTTKPLGAGTGMGLSMVYGFARQSSGDARIESAMGQGTTVILYLPLYRGSPSTADGGMSSTDNDKEPAAGPRGSVLIVDDEVAIRDLISECLQEEGYETVNAATAAEALQQLRQLPDLKLLITDVGMPGDMSGDDLAAAVLKVQPNLKVLIISGFAENTLSSITLKSGHTELLLKPFDVSELKSRVKYMLASRDVQAARVESDTVN